MKMQAIGARRDEFGVDGRLSDKTCRLEMGDKRHLTHWSWERTKAWSDVTRRDEGVVGAYTVHEAAWLLTHKMQSRSSIVSFTLYIQPLARVRVFLYTV